MSEANTNRERAKIRELARDYRSKGYRVMVSPRGTALPQFLRPLGYLPDLIATSKRGSHVVEVSSRDTAQRLRELSPIVEAIEQRQGWEFVLVMTETNMTTAQAITARLCKEIEASPFAGSMIQDGLPVTGSIGVAVTNGDDETSEALLKRADDALYDAKRAGRNQVVAAAG